MCITCAKKFVTRRISKQEIFLAATYPGINWRNLRPDPIKATTVSTSTKSSSVDVIAREYVQESEHRHNRIAIIKNREEDPLYISLEEIRMRVINKLPR